MAETIIILLHTIEYDKSNVKVMRKSEINEIMIEKVFEITILIE